jgi:preprotein translocase subunit SecY
MVIYVFALHIPVPNVNRDRLAELINSSAGLLNFIDIFGGGALSRLSILALGIMPYITSSIVFQILTIAFPYFKELQREGEYGRRKMAQWTRWAAIALTIIQSTMAARALAAFDAVSGNVSDASFVFNTVIALTAGTMFLLWLGEQITEKGVGNGISFIIFAGIVASLPTQMAQMVQTAQWYQIVAMLVAFVATTWAIIYVTQGERRIPIRYAPRHVGGKQVQAQRSYLPLKMAAAGVIPIIFAVSIVLFPGQIATFYLTSSKVTGGMGFTVATTIQNWFSPQSLFASLVYAALVMGFTYFYTAVIFDVRDLADNLKKFGGQIQGYAPGRPTQLFIDRVLTRITFAGGLFLASVALLQWWAPTLLGLGNNAGAAGTLVGGTSLLIVVGVALEIMNNLDQQLKMRQYEGFVRQMKKGRL